MKTFRYQGLDAAGGRRTGIIEAESGKEALRKLAGTGVFAERVEPLAGENARGMPSGRRAVFYRGLSTLLRAGLPLDRALTLLMGENGAAGTDAAIAPIRDAVCEGRSFAVAVAGDRNAVDVLRPLMSVLVVITGNVIGSGVTFDHALAGSDLS